MAGLRSMRSVFIVYVDDDVIWMVDEYICGLYRIDKNTFESECMVDFYDLFRYGKFVPDSLFEWKRDFIVIVPRETNKKWIIYNKLDGQIEYKDVVGMECSCRLVRICEATNKVYFCPESMRDPILIVDFNDLSVARAIQDWSIKMPVVSREETWKGAYNERYLFFPLRGTEVIARMTYEDEKTDFLTVDIPETIEDIDFGFGEFWILPMDGDKIYRVDENGAVLEYVKLTAEDKAFSASEFARIVVQERFIFLLPYTYRGIYVYDKLKGEAHVISDKNSVLPETPGMRNVQYWGYYAESGQICFLPSRNKFLRVEMDSLAYEQKDIDYPKAWTDAEIVKKYNWIYALNGNSWFFEKEKDSLDMFLEYVKREKDDEVFVKKENIGEKIWSIGCG